MTPILIMVRLSLIIATYNRSAQLLVALRSVAAQTAVPEEWECIVVDNNSSDDTQRVFGDFAGEHPSLNLRIVTETNQGLSYARNRGIAESRGEYVAVIDDDERVNPEFIRAYTDLFDAHPDCVAAGGRVVPEYPSGRPAWMSRFTEKPVANPTDWGCEVRPFPAGRIPAGGNMAFRRDALLRYGGFDTSLGRVGSKLTGGEESDLFERMADDGVRFTYVPDAIIWHIIPSEKLTADYFARLSFNTGVSQRRRAELHGRVGRLFAGETVKWGATLVLAVCYIATLRPSKGIWLVKMRYGISRGIMRKE